MISFPRQSFIAKARVAPLVAVLLLPSVIFGQQQPAARKKSPSLTTEDMVKPSVQPPSSESEGLTDKPAAAEEAGSAQPASGGAVSPEELLWREQLASARARAKAAQRESEEAELRITALRNQLSVSGQTPQERNETAAQLDEAGRQVTELRAAAKAAAAELAGLIEVGRLKKFGEAPGPERTTENGSANHDYYKSRFTALNEELQEAERRAQLYEDRLRDVSQRILQNGGKNGGDNFYLAHLQEERQDAQEHRDEARAAVAKAHSDLDALKEEARRAGVPPGVFR
ncbi:MAG TPA: hypothetical protein VFB82_18990 [Blastocatellia bacterium]|nr:hypothetical protein [Blastocatellia bacterium]